MTGSIERINWVSKIKFKATNVGAIAPNSRSKQAHFALLNATRCSELTISHQCHFFVTEFKGIFSVYLITN